MNKAHDYRALEREYITTDISIRELCRRHGITAHSLVTVQAKKNGWADKREAYHTKASEAYIEKHAARQADRVAEVQDDALELISEGINKAREDMRATKLARQPDGTITEEPAWYMKPREVALLIDRLEVLFGRPSSVSQHQGLEIRAEFTPEALREFIEATRGWGARPG